jgi:hypothetical protein
MLQNSNYEEFNYQICIILIKCKVLSYFRIFRSCESVRLENAIIAEHSVAGLI